MRKYNPMSEMDQITIRKNCLDSINANMEYILNAIMFDPFDTIYLLEADAALTTARQKIAVTPHRKP